MKKEMYSGFTLVEISIVMIIIGLLIGGVFGGIKLVENMQVNKTVQDLKSIESAALTFKDTYGRLPGDLTNPSVRLPNCTVAPCATGGNGNRILGTAILGSGAISATDENFTFWHHLQAANLLSMGYKNTTDMTVGEGQPEPAIGGALRISDWNTNVGGCPIPFSRSAIATTSIDSAAFTSESVASCSSLESIDRKIDDGMPDIGKFIMGWNCVAAGTVCTRNYSPTGTGTALYDLKGF
jgi:prepilin-type N-terminal cleavage/methylation domain-containing protein